MSKVKINSQEQFDKNMNVIQEQSEILMAVHTSVAQVLHENGKEPLGSYEMQEIANRVWAWLA